MKKKTRDASFGDADDDAIARAHRRQASRAHQLPLAAFSEKRSVVNIAARGHCCCREAIAFVAAVVDIRSATATTAANSRHAVFDSSSSSLSSPPIPCLDGLVGRA